MTTHSIILAWRILWTEGSGGLQSMGLPRVRHGSYYHSQQHNSPSHVILLFTKQIPIQSVVPKMSFIAFSLVQDPF